MGKSEELIVCGGVGGLVLNISYTTKNMAYKKP
jgi:hypothetical protein